MRKSCKLNELIEIIVKLVKDAGFANQTIYTYRMFFSKLLKLASVRNEEHYTYELGQAFIASGGDKSSANYCRYQDGYYRRCIQFIESYIKTGEIDWSVNRANKRLQLNSMTFKTAEVRFAEHLLETGLSQSTRRGYRRLVYYFLSYLDNKGYESFHQIISGDVVSFIVSVCRNHYATTSLRANLPGLKMFLGLSKDTELLIRELPERLPTKKDILKVYTDEEHEKIVRHLDNETISYRDKAICLLALETGLRSVDIRNLKMRDIDWQHDNISIIQAKTGRRLSIPLRASYGNALTDYLICERPSSDSEFVFLREKAPYEPLKSHSACRYILYHVIKNAGIAADGRAFGTRITRHSTASRMLRRGIPLPVISEALGHGNPNSVMVYLSTEESKLSRCTLPLPRKGGECDE